MVDSSMRSPQELRGAGWRKPETEQRLSDHISIRVLTRTYPPELVDRVVAETGKTEARHRLLPARVVVYYVADAERPGVLHGAVTCGQSVRFKVPQGWA